MIFFACLAWLALRLLYNGWHELAPDEAYYWVWSRHLAWGYLDHPFMVAWLIRWATLLLGDTESGVRLPAALLMFGCILLCLAMARRIGATQREVTLVGIILIFSPLVAGLSSIMTPDTPACFFSLLTVLFAMRAFEGQKALDWIALGISMGLAMDSKYTAVLTGISIALVALAAPAWRRMLWGTWPWLSVLVAVAVFLPVVAWNRDHAWASFAFQLHHGADADRGTPGRNLASYAGGEALIYTPVLFGIGLAALVSSFHRWRSLSEGEQLLAVSATLPLVFFAITSLRHKPELNWPAFAYFPLTILAARWVMAKFESRRKWVELGICISGAALVVISAPEIMKLVPVKRVANLPSRWDAIYGWRDMAAEIQLQQMQSGSDGLVCTSYENTAEATFYISGHPNVLMAGDERDSAFAYFADQPLVASLHRIVCVRRVSGPGEMPALPAALQAAGFKTQQVEHWETIALGRRVRRREMVIASR